MAIQRLPEPGLGHNGGPPMEGSDASQANANRLTQQAKDNLAALADRIKNVREEKKALGEAEREIFAEAKAMGYDQKALRAALARQAAEEKDKQALEEHEQIRDLYLLVLQEQSS